MDAAFPSLKSRFRGALGGVLAGDCLGSIFEGPYWNSQVPASEITGHFSEVQQMALSKQEFLQFTDDTAMSLSVAASLATKRAFDGPDMATRFVTEYYRENWRGYGGNVVTVFERLRERGFRPEAPYATRSTASRNHDIDDATANAANDGTTQHNNIPEWEIPASEQFNGTGSKGNGGGMRAAPVGLFGYHSVDETVRVAVSQARITHTHPEGVAGSVLQSLAVRKALRMPVGELNPLRFVDEIKEEMREFETSLQRQQDSSGYDAPNNQGQPQQGSGIMECLDAVKDMLREGQERLGDQRDTDFVSRVCEVLGSDVTASRSVPTALFCFLYIVGVKAGSFADVVAFSISLGGDTDTIASMAASLAGAYMGAEAIPEAWQRACEGWREMMQMADALYGLSGAPVSE
ncbi:unnamed protein product [Vitrella brassicaformis CCMP3155]|uniref:ADP-ribosylhydrolase ARH3 n=2 Tax=Vitrella brassicaformis TaxID=1169539 RepID=A0A0G4EVP6_VITBC|nr:unnamed protein product [Vitrella brassicaformis CCMP3155]|eukprot:CEM02497.1 unnamed protein product [Vitrella brassicaformis CCMP3155]